MAGPVRTNIEATAWSDPRFATLAMLLDLGDRDYAMVKMARVWCWQIERYTADAPTYVVDRSVVNGAFGSLRAADAVVEAGLAELQPDGRLRICGGRDDKGKSRISWRWDDQQQRIGAGKSRAARATAGGRSAGGRWIPAGESVQRNTSEPPAGYQRAATEADDGPADDQRPTSETPALRTPDSGSQISFSPGEAGKLAELAIDLLNTARHALDPSAPPLAALVSTPDLAGIKRSLEPVPAADRESTLRHAVAVLAAWVKAEKGQPIGELRLGQLCGERSWARWVAGTVASEKKRGSNARASPTAATATPATHHGTGTIDPRDV